MEQLKHKRARRTTARRQSAKVSNMTQDELREMIETSVEHRLIEWFGDPADLRDEQEWARQFARSQDTLNRLADEALEELRQGKTEPLDPERL